MAEFVLSGVLALYKQSRFFTDRQREGRWEKRRDLRELAGRRVTILGCGSVGTECAKRFAAFGCRVTGVDLFPRSDEAYEAMLPLDRLDEVLSGTDLLVLTLPLSPETRHLLDARLLALLPQDALVVNISRGAVLDEAALAAALQTGRLSGAVLDVFETEPLPEGSPLWDMDNVILTPHNSFVGEGNDARLSRLILERLREAAQERKA
jgi:phosphoglycerate dehydrogenase-like enzyme